MPARAIRSRRRSDRVEDFQVAGDLVEPGGQVGPDLLAGLELEHLVGEPLGLGGRDRARAAP